MVTIYTIGEYLQICTIIPVTIGGICMIIQYQRASFYHHHNLKLPLGHGLLRLTIMMTTILFAIDAFQLWLPIPINYLIDYTLTEFCIICCGLYVRILLLTCYKGVLRVRIPHILTFRHMLLFSTLFVLFSTIPILIAIVYNTIRMTLWFFVLQAIGCFTIVTLGSTVYIILWRTVTQSASLVGRIGYTHPLRTSLWKFIMGCMTVCCGGIYLTRRALIISNTTGALLLQTSIGTGDIIRLVGYPIMIYIIWIKPVLRPNTIRVRRPVQPRPPQ